MSEVSALFNLEDTIQFLIQYFFTGIGYAMIFKKCGVKPWYAFVPCLRQYSLGICADRMREGRVLALLEFFLIPLNFMKLDVSDAFTVWSYSFAVAFMALGFITMVYLIRVMIGLCNVFQRKRFWVLPLVFLTPFAALIWGLNKNFVPYSTVQERQVRAAALKNTEIDSIEKGLTVNLKYRSVSDFLQKKYLLRDIHISIPTGHMVLLLGGSGAGKTTFLNAVTGYEKANAKITLHGDNVYKHYDRMKYEIGFVPQQDLMRGSDTVRMTLKDAATLRLPYETPGKEKRDRVMKLLDLFGLTPVKTSLVEKLSGGQRKRLSIAMEFISDPQLFILDEPDSGLDGVAARSLFERLRHIADEGRIVIVITHTPDRVADLFDDVIVLAKDANRTGRLAYYGPVKDAYGFFGADTMEGIVRTINREEEGGLGRADELIEKFASGGAV